MLAASTQGVSARTCCVPRSAVSKVILSAIPRPATVLSWLTTCAVSRGTSSLTDLDGQHQPQIRSLVILGATGDLSARLLLPGLASLVVRDEAPDLRLVGAGTSDWSEQQWRERVAESFEATAAQRDATELAALERMLGSTTYRKVDVTAPGALAELVGSVESPVAVYFALPPEVRRPNSPRSSRRL